MTRLGHQARVQHQQRTEKRPIVERLPIAENEGLCRLPPPSPGDLFLDLEGAPFAREGGREYLFGVWGRPGGDIPRVAWALDDAEEKAAFEAVIDLIMQAWAADPGHARLSLQSLRADRVQEADGALRDARGGARSPAPRGAVRRSLSHRPGKPCAPGSRAIPSSSSNSIPVTQEGSSSRA